MSIDCKIKKHNKHENKYITHTNLQKRKLQREDRINEGGYMPQDHILRLGQEHKLRGTGSYGYNVVGQGTQALKSGKKKKG